MFSGSITATFAWLWIVTFSYFHLGGCAKIPYQLERGNITFGSLFAIHHKGESDIECGELNPITGVIFYEAFRYAIDKINSNKSILFGASLGHVTVDTCMSAARLKLYLRNLIVLYGGAGFIGPATSDESIYVSPVLSIFDIPMISYYSSSIDLDDRHKYDNLYRTVPSDKQQVHAIVDVLKAFNWSYVSTVNSNGNYGQRGMEYFTTVAKSRSICISKQKIISSSPQPEEYKNIIQDLMTDDKVRVIILITTATDTRGLFRDCRTQKVENGRFIWIGSTAWGTELQIVKGLENEAEGALVLSYADKLVPEFQNHLSKLTLSTSRNAWLPELVETLYNCSFKSPSITKKRCSGKESLSEVFTHELRIPTRLVMETVYTFACAFRQVILLRCPTPHNRTSCIFAFPPVLTQYSYNERKLVQYILRTNRSQCKGVMDSVNFQADGATAGNFEILNFHKNSIGDFRYSSIGRWRLESTANQHRMNIDYNAIAWPTNYYHKTPKSTCSPMCTIDEIKITDPSRPKCCWLCKKCKESDLVINQTACIPCPQFHLPDANRRICNKLPLRLIDIGSPKCVVTILLSITGIILTLFIMFLFVKHKQKKLIRSSGRELSILILCGILSCFLTPLIFFANASPFVCGLKRLAAGISLSACYTPLLLKILRIYRIFDAATKSIRRPILISPKSQVMICLGSFLLQLLLGLVWIISDPPKIATTTVDQGQGVSTYCLSNDSSLILTLVICFVLVACCTYMAFRTRNFPKNYNEAKSIGITMYITISLWSVFVPVYLFIKSGDGVYKRTIVAGLFCDVLALMTLIGLFGPKLYLLARYGDIKQDSATVYTHTEKESEITIRRTKIEPITGCQCVRHRGVDRTTSTSDLQRAKKEVQEWSH